MRWLVIVVALARVASADEPAKRGGPVPQTGGDDLATELAITGSLARGVTDRTLVTARGSLTADAGPWGAFAQTNWVFGEVNGRRSDDELYLRTLAFRSFAERCFWFGVAVGEHSLHRMIDERLFAGGGLGTVVVRTRDAKLLASLGAVDEITWFGDPLLGERTVARATLRLYGRYALAPIALTHDAYVMPSTKDLRAIAYVALDVPLVHGLAGRVAFDASYEQVIAAGTEHGDLAVTFGLAYAGAWQP